VPRIKRIVNYSSFSRSATAATITGFAGLVLLFSPAVVAAERFDGQFYRGEGDTEYLQLLDISRRMFEPDPEFQNMAMFYMPATKEPQAITACGSWTYVDSTQSIPDGIRTCNLRLRRPTLYPIELRGRPQQTHSMGTGWTVSTRAAGLPAGGRAVLRLRS
jgi:hypothetical protein